MLFIKKIVLKIALAGIVFSLISLGTLTLCEGNFYSPANRAEASETQTLAKLKLGDRVVDKSWEWEFRTGENFSFVQGDVKKPLVWIVVAKDHYPEGGVTLLSEDIITIPYHLFQWVDSDRMIWGDSDKRKWFNSTGKFTDNGFDQSFSEGFRTSIISVTLPNLSTRWRLDNHDIRSEAYNTLDRIFIPSTTELGSNDAAPGSASFNEQNYMTPIKIGDAFQYFLDAEANKRIANFNGTPGWYDTRTPYIGDYADVFTTLYMVTHEGKFTQIHPEYHQTGSWTERSGNRPALNLPAATTVSMSPNADGIYEIVGYSKTTAPSPRPVPVDGLGDVTGSGRIDVNDVNAAMQHVLGLKTLNNAQFSAADVNADGIVDINDVVLITKYAIGLIDSF